MRKLPELCTETFEVLSKEPLPVTINAQVGRHCICMHIHSRSPCPRPCANGTVNLCDRKLHLDGK